MSKLRQVRWKTLRKKAREARAMSDGFPVPVKDIAEMYGVRVKMMKFKDSSVSGAIGYRDNQVTIAVNDDHHEYRQNFTMAHELGHYLLHPHSMVVDRALFRNTVSSQAVSVEEIEANGFAAELLMPEHDVREQAREYPALCEDEIKQLCKRYEVSPMAMTIRLTSLGLMM